MNTILIVVAIMQQIIMLVLIMVIMRFVKGEPMKRPTSTFDQEIKAVQKIEGKRDRMGWTDERKEAHRIALRAAHERKKKAQQNGVTAEPETIT